jgi:hypothetical protein
MSSLSSLCKRSKVILWGNNTSHRHTHYWVFASYYRILKKSGVDVCWCEDDISQLDNIRESDLVFIHGSNRFVSEVLKTRAFIVDFHSGDLDQSVLDLLNGHDKRISELEYTEQHPSVIGSDLRIDRLTVWNSSTRILAQPWGTDLDVDEFLSPCLPVSSKVVYWCGSVWSSSSGWGNTVQIRALRESLEDKDLEFVVVNDADRFGNPLLTRASRIAPSISGEKQAEANLLVCRFFKNISYGCVPPTNVSAAQELFGESVFFDSNIDSVVSRALDAKWSEYYERVLDLQERISCYTVRAHLTKIFSVARSTGWM